MSLFNKPSFSSQYGNNDFSIRNEDGTLSEERGDPKSKKPKTDAAEVINASANGLDAITNFMAPFLGGSTPAQQNYSPPPPPKKKVNPLLVGGVIGGVALIILLIVLNNGKSTK